MILIKTEKAFARFLIGIAGQLVTGTGTYIVTGDCIHIRLTNGLEYSLPVLRGQDEREVSAPAVIVYAPSGEQVEFGTQTHRVDVRITLVFPADEQPGQTKLLDAFEYAAQQLVAGLFIDDLLVQVSQLEPDFSLIHQFTRWTAESNWEERKRLVRLQAQFYAVPEDMPVVPAPSSSPS